MIACVDISVFTGFIFLIVLLFVAASPNDVIEGAAGPPLQIFLKATESQREYLPFDVSLFFQIGREIAFEGIIFDEGDSFPLMSPVCHHQHHDDQ